MLFSSPSDFIYPLRAQFRFSRYWRNRRRRMPLSTQVAKEGRCKFNRKSLRSSFVLSETRLFVTLSRDALNCTSARRHPTRDRLCRLLKGPVSAPFRRAEPAFSARARAERSQPAPTVVTSGL